MSKRLKARGEIEEEGSVSLIPIMNLVCLLIPFLLYTASFVVFATVDVTTNRNVPCQNCQDIPPLSLTVLITDQGFRIASSGEGALPASCGESAEPGSTLHIPLSRDGESCSDRRGYPSLADRRERQARHLGPPSCAYDFEQLNRCMVDIKSEHPDQTRIVISGEPATDFNVLIHTMDATRGDGSAPLFPDVALAAGLV